MVWCVLWMFVSETYTIRDAWKWDSCATDTSAKYSRAEGTITVGQANDYLKFNKSMHFFCKNLRHIEDYFVLTVLLTLLKVSCRYLLLVDLLQVQQACRHDVF